MPAYKAILTTGETINVNGDQETVEEDYRGVDNQYVGKLFMLIDVNSGRCAVSPNGSFTLTALKERLNDLLDS